MGRRILGFALILMLVACGKDPQPLDDPGKQPDPVSPPPSTGGGSQSGGVCNFFSPAVGIRILDLPGERFGKILANFSNGSSQVEWEQDGSKSIVTWPNLRTAGSCDPDITNKRVLYTGTSSAGFPDPNQGYTGTLKGVYAGGYADIDWDHLTENVAVPFDSIALEQ